MSGSFPDIAAEDEASAKILLVEDDLDFASELAAFLADYGMQPVHAADWEGALAMVTQEAPDLLVLDQRLGRVDMLPRLGQIRSLTTAPILVLTGNRAETDRIVALEIGADDFLLKPISGRELVARIRAHLRRVGHGRKNSPAAAAAPQAAMQPGAAAPPPSLAMGNAKPLPAMAPHARWALSISDRQLRRPDGTEVVLTAAEFDLLAALAKAPGEPVDRETLTQLVLHRAWRPDDRALDNIVLHLRQKLGPGGERSIATIRNRGYAFTSFPTAGG